MSLSLLYEKKFWNQGIRTVIGIDEVGRGCLAGPVTIAAVMFDPQHLPIKGVNDSKKISAKNREMLSKKIIKQAKKYTIQSGSVRQINNLGISKTLSLCIDKAISVLDCQTPKHILIDGKYKPSLKSTTQEEISTIIKGDGLCYSIAAASIIAKVARDEHMCTLHKQNNNYDWNNNKGYGTKKHRESLVKHGPTQYHRDLFIRKTLSSS